MLVKHWQRVAETRFKYQKKIQMAVDEARACRHPHGLKDKLKPNPTQQDALKGMLPLKKVSVYIGRRSYELVIEQPEEWLGGDKGDVCLIQRLAYWPRHAQIL